MNGDGKNGAAPLGALVRALPGTGRAPADRFDHQSLSYARIGSIARSLLVRELARTRHASPASFFALLKPRRKAFRDRLATGTDDG